MAQSADVGAGLAASFAPTRFEAFIPRRSIVEDAHFDLTAMVDLVFMMNIFFLVTSITTALAEMDLPTARNCAPTNEDDCVVISLQPGLDPDRPLLLVGDQDEREATWDLNEQEQRVREAAERAVRENEGRVLIKGERNVRLKDTARISSIVSSVEGAQLMFAVVELDVKD